MAYWLDEGWHCWPEIVRAGTAAAGLYSRCGSYIADNTTDGWIPTEVARMYGTAEWAQRLVDVGLWTIEGDGGYRDMRYFPLNKSRERIDKEKADAAARQRKRRHGGSDQQKTSRVTHGKLTRESQGASRVTHASPSLPTGGAGPPAHTREGAGAPARSSPVAEHEPGCSYANTNRPATSCSICAAIRAGPDERPTNGGPADPDEARALARAVAARGRPSTPPPVAPDPPADPPRAGPTADEVWMSAPRRGVDYHRLASPRRTGCGEPTTGGGRLTTTEAADFGTPCPRCWPPPTTQESP